MNLHYFFEGKLGREEAASAFLATMLEQHPEFRQAFFRLLSLPENEHEDLKKEEWSVVTEEYEVDVTMHPQKGSHVVLIENKIQPGSKTAGQVKKYFSRQIKMEPEKDVLFYYLAPNESTGVSELSKTNFRENDVGVSISWDDIFDILDDIDLSERERESVNSSVDSIRKIIKTTYETKYELVGPRAIIDDIIKTTAVKIKSEFPQVSFLTWNAKQTHLIYTCKTNVTAYMNLSFEAEDEPPYRPLIEDRDGNLSLTLKSSFKISGKGKKDPETKLWWNDTKNSRSIPILPGGDHVFNDETEFYVNEIQITTSKKVISERYYEMSRSLLSKLLEQL